MYRRIRFHELEPAPGRPTGITLEEGDIVTNLRPRGEFSLGLFNSKIIVMHYNHPPILLGRSAGTEYWMFLNPKPGEPNTYVALTIRPDSLFRNAIFQVTWDGLSPEIKEAALDQEEIWLSDQGKI